MVWAAAVFVLGCCEVLSAGDAEWAELGGGFIYRVNTGGEMTKLDMGGCCKKFSFLMGSSGFSERSGVNLCQNKQIRAQNCGFPLLAW